MIKIPVSLWIAVPMLLAVSGCDVSTCEGDECDFDSVFDEDGGTSDGGDDQDGGNGGESDGGESDGGGSGADGGGSNGQPITLDEFCEEQVRVGAAWRDKLDECSCVDFAGADRDSFLQTTFFYRGTADCAAALQASIDAKSVKFEPTKAQACADAFALAFKGPDAGCPAAGFDLSDIRVDQGHGTPVLAQIPVCREALAGQIKKNMACESIFDCADGLRCLVVSGSGGTNKDCRDPVPESGACAGRSDCADDLTCAGSSAGSGLFCRAKDDLVDVGGNCSADQQCRTGFICQNAKCASPAPDLVCVP